MKADKFKCGCAVVGGGAAGMMAALTAAGHGVNVILIEHTKRLGSKLLQTGNGKCNFTNLDMGKEHFQNEDREFVGKVLESFQVSDTLEFFKEIGIYSRQRGGYVYPNSETAASLQDALRAEVERSGVIVYTECQVERIKRERGGFVLETNQGRINADTLILATGSKAAPKTGSDGSGYILAKSLSHSIIKPLPALVQLTSDNRQCKVMAGVRSTGRVTIYADGKKLAEDLGEIQYTEYGISGIPVFQVSRYAVKAKDRKKEVLAVVDMLPEFSEEELREDIRKRLEKEENKDIVSFFAGLLNKKLVQGVVKSVGADMNMTAGQAGEKKLYRLVREMKEYSFDITGSRSYEYAQVCQGGVKLSEVNPESMESRLCRGLYFAGELLDVDGKCGGYNLQWAWSSGYLAGKSAAEVCND
ncbi:MAG: NAD(P)/FAD-dependent oxidoreductase [Lachnospira sp.]|nr:NAD(P)/FAD-dependent oxidoreductase [Lachnospira sp.]